MIKLPEILKNRSYRNLYLAGASSELGTFVTETALMLWVFSLSGDDKSILGLTRSVFLIFFTLGGIIGGPIGVRFKKKNILLMCEFARIPIIILLAFIHETYFIIFANGFIALFTGIFNPARQALVNEIVEKENIKKANSLFGSTFATLHLIGPITGATLYSYFDGMREILTFDFLSYILGILLLFKIKSLSVEVGDSNQKNKQSFIGDLKEGLQYLKERRDLQAIFSNAVIAGFVVGAIIPLLLPYTLEVLNTSESFYGILMSIFGLGGIAGGFLCHKLSLKYKTSHIILGAILVEPILMLVWLQILNPSLSLLIFFLWGASVFTRIPAQLNYLSESVPLNYLTRMHAVLDMAFVVPNIGAGLVVSAIGDEMTTQNLLYIFCGIFILFTIPRLKFGSLKVLYNKENP